MGLWLAKGVGHNVMRHYLGFPRLQRQLRHTPRLGAPALALALFRVGLITSKIVNQIGPFVADLLGICWACFDAELPPDTRKYPSNRRPKPP
jgi:hypothetical protein